MKQRKIFIMGVLALTMMTLGFTTTVFAKPDNKGAKITRLPWARLPADDSGLAVDLWTYEEALQIETPSGKVILIAHFDIPEEYRPSKAMINSGFLVTTWAAGDSYNTMSVVTPGGRALLRAII
jgi:hypothetical protein